MGEHPWDPIYFLRNVRRINVPKRSVRRIEKLEREKAKLEKEIRIQRGLIELQIKAHEILGIAPPRVEDEALGLDQMGARSYAADLGVWISPDPIAAQNPEALVGHFSAASYTYAGANPVRFVDRAGLLLRGGRVLRRQSGRAGGSIYVVGEAKEGT